MKDFFKASSMKVLVISVVVLLGLIIYTATAGGSFLASILGFVSSPMQSIATDVTGNVTEFLDLDGYSRDELKALVESLKAENSQLREQLIDYANTKLENEQLKEQLKISEAMPENEMRSAFVIGRDPNDVFSGFSIDKGTLAGVSVGDPVITSQGLVGIVTQAYPTTSLVSCLLSEDVKVAAVCVDRQESGVISSDIMTASSGLLRLDYLSAETQIQEGDIITTSGAGGVYPEHLIIGRVERVERSANDVSRYAVVRPYEDLTAVRDVQVVVSFPGEDAEGRSPAGEEAPAGEEDPE